MQLQTSLQNQLKHVITLSAGLGLAFLSACSSSQNTASGALDEPNETPTEAAKILLVDGVAEGSSEAPTFRGQIIEIVGTLSQDGEEASVMALQPGDAFTAEQDIAAGKAARQRIRLRGIDVRHAVRGPVEALNVDQSSLSVLGQTVLVDALTHLYDENADESYSTMTLADLQPGDAVEVSGERQADGQIQATRIERERGDFDADAQVQIRGVVADLDEGAQIFFVAAQQVDFASAQIIGTLVEGAPVRLEGSLTGTLLVASDIKLGTASRRRGDAGQEIEVQGVVGALDRVAGRFVVNGYRVDFNTAEIDGSLVNGGRIEAEGVLDASAPDLLIARSVEVYHSRGGAGYADRELKGPLRELDALEGLFMIGGRLCYSDANTVFEIDDREASLADFAEGDFVAAKVKPQLLDEALYVLKLELETDSRLQPGEDAQANPRRIELEGSIRNFVNADRSFMINEVEVAVTPDTRYEIDDQISNAETFFAADRTGSEAEVQGEYDGSRLTARKIQLETQMDEEFPEEEEGPAKRAYGQGH